MWRHTAIVQVFFLLAAELPPKQSPSSSLQSQRPRIPMGKEAGRRWEKSRKVEICFKFDIIILKIEIE